MAFARANPAAVLWDGTAILCRNAGKVGPLMAGVI